MNADMDLPIAFLAGLAGAGHCWAMCGGLAGGLFLASGKRGAGRAVLTPHLAYHAGRVLAYTLLGAVAALLGQAVVLSGGAGRAQGGLYIAAGFLVLLAGARVAGWLPWMLIRPDRWGCRRRGGRDSRFMALMRRHGQDQEELRCTNACPLPQPSRREGAGLQGTCWIWPLAGLLNGLMPCALVFSLALKAATAPSVATGTAWLFAFGLGTVPAMALATALAHWLGRQSLRWLRRAAGILLMLLGLQAVWAGTRFFHVMLHL